MSISAILLLIIAAYLVIGFIVCIAKIILDLQRSAPAQPPYMWRGQYWFLFMFVPVWPILLRELLIQLRLKDPSDDY